MHTHPDHHDYDDEDDNNNDVFDQDYDNEITNLSLLLQSYASRRDISLDRKTVKMPVLNLVGDRCPHLDATITFNMKTDPAKTTWMKITNAGMVLEEQPDKVAEALCLFLQGLGYTVKIGRSRSDTARPTRLDIKGNFIIDKIIFPE